MTIWKTDRSGLTASTQYANGSAESRLLSAIPSEDTILPVDPLTPAEQRSIIQDQINLLEGKQLLPRVTREGLLLTMETFAAMQSITSAQLYIDNIAYHKVKDFDDAIVALRAQMEAIV
jgi:hypothetical protein